MTKYLFLGALLGLAACDGKLTDSGDTGMGMDTADTAETGDTDTGGDTGTTDTFDSCDVAAWGICYEFTNYDGTADWCSWLGTEYGAETTYAADLCASGSVGACALPAEGDLPVEAVAYYYEPEFTETDAAGACTSANGTPL